MSLYFTEGGVEKSDSAMEEATESALSKCETIINQIRKEEFGVGVQLSEDGQKLMKVRLQISIFKMI